MHRIATAIVIAALAAAAHAQSAADSNGPRTNEEQGASGFIKGHEGRGNETLGGVGVSRQQDIRRTSTGKDRLPAPAVEALKAAAKAGELQRSPPVKFTVAVGAAVPQQAGMHALPADLKPKVPSGQALNYIFADDRVILVDAPTRRIVAIVPGMG